MARVLRVLAYVTPREPQLVSIRLQTLHEHVHRNLDRVGHAGAVGAALSVLDPALGRKVGRLGAVEALVEAGVVAVRECDDELARLLRDLKTDGEL